MAELWTQAQPLVTAFIRSMVHDFHDSEDVLQQTAHTVATRFGEFDTSRPFAPWAIGVARLKVMEHWRARQRDLHVFASATMDNIVAAYEAEIPHVSSLRKALEVCISRLEKRSARLLELRYTQDLRPRQIAERLSVSANSVRVALHRVRAAVGRCIEKRMVKELPS